MDRYEREDVSNYATWSGILELLGIANRAYEAVRFNDNAREREQVADELRTIARLIEAAATEVREYELLKVRSA